MNERMNLPLEIDKEEGKDGDLKMIADDFSDSEGDLDVLCNVVSVLPVEYDMVTEVTDA